MPINTDFVSLRFPQNVATNEVPNYVTFTPQQVQFGGTTGLNPISRPNSNIAAQTGSAFGSNNPLTQIRDQIGGAVDSFASGATQAIGAISDVFNTASLSSSLTNLGKIVSGRVNIGPFAINFGQETRPDQLSTKGSINLFLPESLQTASSVDYAAEELGATGIAAVNAARRSQGGNLDAAKSAGELGTGVINELTALSGKTAAVYQFSTGEVANNFSFQIFNGVGHRSFSYSFRMVAKNEVESKSIKDICDMFLFYMLPARTQRGSGSATLHFYEVPAQWKIEYLRMGNLLEYYQQPKACFLQSVDVAYGGEAGANTYNDGAPMDVTLSLEFVEIEPLYRNTERSDSKTGPVSGVNIQNLTDTQGSF